MKKDKNRNLRHSVVSRLKRNEDQKHGWTLFIQHSTHGQRSTVHCTSPGTADGREGENMGRRDVEFFLIVAQAIDPYGVLSSLSPSLRCTATPSGYELAMSSLSILTDSLSFTMTIFFLLLY